MGRRAGVKPNYIPACLTEEDAEKCDVDNEGNLQSHRFGDTTYSLAPTHITSTLGPKKRDRIGTGANSRAYKAGWDRTFGK